MCRYHTSGSCVAIGTQLPDLPAYTNCDVQLIEVAPEAGLKGPKHVEHLMNIKTNYKNLCNRLVYLFIYT